MIARGLRGNNAVVDLLLPGEVAAVVVKTLGVAVKPVTV